MSKSFRPIVSAHRGSKNVLTCQNANKWRHNGSKNLLTCQNAIKWRHSGRKNLLTCQNATEWRHSGSKTFNSNGHTSVFKYVISSKLKFLLVLSCYYYKNYVTFLF